MNTLDINCAYKVQYGGKDEALAAIHRKYRKEVLGVYHCPVCAGWHLTALKEESKKERTKKPYPLTTNKRYLIGFKMERSTNKVSYRDAFKPSAQEIEAQRQELIEIYGDEHAEYLESKLKDWIETETDYRMEEGVADTRFEKLEKVKTYNLAKRSANEKGNRRFN